MFDHLPEPVDESNANYQLFHQLKSLEEGARAEFEHALAARDLIDIDGMHNGIVATFDVQHNRLNVPVTMTLTVAYETAGHYRHGWDPKATVNARLSPDEEAIEIGSLDRLLTDDSSDQDVDVIVEWTPDNDIPFPAAPNVSDGPIERPQAVIDESEEMSTVIDDRSHTSGSRRSNTTKSPSVSVNDP